MKKLILGVSAMVLMANSLSAQDIHYTQYFTSPLTLNPALTGLTQCDLRLSANYRVQWASVSANPYRTGMIGYDMAVLKGKLPQGDALGIGIMGLYDKSGLGGLQNTTVAFSLAYHKAFGKQKQHNISLGVQAMLVQKSIDFAKLKFEDQFDPNSGGTPYPTSEVIAQSLSYPDFNAGIMYTGRLSEHATGYAGFSYYHLTQPVETFMSSNHQIHSRQTFTLGGSFDLNENLVLYASGLYQSQAAASEIVLGAAIGFILNPGNDPEYQKNTILYLGGWYRYADAISPYVGFEWSKMKLGVSYDINVSSFTPATGGAGAYEISLIYNGCINKGGSEPSYKVPCPKF